MLVRGRASGQYAMATGPSSLTPEQPLTPGELVGDYVIEGLLGKGTFGSVYRGIQPDIGKRVAIKVLALKFSTDPGVLSRFVLEARAVNQIQHRNIIDIFTFGQLPDGRHYHVMELLDGQPLDEHLAKRGERLQTEEAFSILRGVARALDAAHAKGIVHRDLKPANVFLTRDEEGQPFPKLLDFGIAKLLTDDLPRTHQTATGAAVGTPDYMSPEQCRGPEVDHRSDVYAFGVLAFRLLTGTLPFRAPNIVEVMMLHMTASPPVLSDLVPDLGTAFDAPFKALLAKLPKDRPSSARAAVAELEAAARREGHPLPAGQITIEPETSSTVPGSTAANLARPGSRRNFLLGAVGGGALLATAGLFLFRGSPEPRVEAIPPRPSSETMERGPPARPKEEPGKPGGEGQPSLESAAEPKSGSGPAAAASEASPEAPEAKEIVPVRLRLRGSPRGAVVRSESGEELGKLPCSIELTQGLDPVVLTVEAPGFLPQKIEVVPRRSRRLKVRLRRRQRVRPSRNELEEPKW